MYLPNVLLGQRPPIGLIVEGHSEYEALPSIVGKTLGGSVGPRPLLARGSGDVIANLREHLEDIVKTQKPFVVIVCLDMKDPLHSGSFTSCAQLREHLVRIAEQWLAEGEDRQDLQPLPTRIEIVVQVPTFESWIISDPDGLANCEKVKAAECTHQWANVDTVEDPHKWLGTVLRDGISLKRRGVPKALVSAISLERARQGSKSLDKFCREVQRAYDEWVYKMTN